jgi:hypothetical protein
MKPSYVLLVAAVLGVVAGAWVLRGRRHGGGERQGGVTRVRGAGPNGGQNDQSRHEAGALAVTLSDGKSVSWTLQDLRRVSSRSDIPTEQGAASAWSLRDVAATLADGKARIASVTNTKGETLAITPSEWSDTSRLPLLRLNHRGMWKFDWVDAASRESLESGMREVSGLTLAP